MRLPFRPLPPLPESFVFGVATADHQCEAYDPAHEDIWDVWERRVGLTPRGSATDFWERYAEDVARARDLGCAAFRFSHSWARLEPRPGEYDASAFEHYRAISAAIRAAGMEPIVTLLHFTWPLHVEERGGLIDDRFPGIFAAYADEVVNRLGDSVRDWITINEPTQLVYGYIKPWWEAAYRIPPGLPPGASFAEQVEAVAALMRNLFLAHTAARAAIKRRNKAARVGANPLLLGLPVWLQRIVDRNATRLRDHADLAASARRFAARPRTVRGDVDVIVAALTATPTRARSVAFSTPYAAAARALLVTADSDVYTPSDLARRRLAVVAGSTTVSETAFAAGAQKQVVPSYAAAIDALDAGQVAAVAGDDIILQAVASRRPGTYRLITAGPADQPYAVGVSHGDPALLEVVNQAVERFRQQKIPGWADPATATIAHPVTNRLAVAAAQRIRAGPAPAAQAPPGSLLRRIQDRGYLRAGIRTDVPGLGWLDPKTGALEGIEIELAREIAREIFGDPNRVTLVPTTAARRVSRLCSPLQLLDPLFQIYSVLSTVLTSNWWHLGMAGRLPTFLCPSSCVGQQDFIGFDYYWGIPSLRLDRLRHLLAAAVGRFDDAPVWPGALHGMLRYHAALFPGLPIVICENGCVERADGVDRASYLRRHVQQVQRAVRDGVNVAAYLCWSITSNREWGLPFGPGSDFGLYHIDLDADPTLTRTPTEAAGIFRTIARTRRAEGAMYSGPASFPPPTVGGPAAGGTTGC